MLCLQCNATWPYRTGAKACITCGGKLRLSAEDLLGDTPARIVTEVRPAQVEFAKVVERGMLARQHVTAEAGTGTGKSFAILLPAILSGKRVVVSTATTLLQSQYMEKDLPFLERELARHNVEFTYALAKGKSHYLCRVAMKKAVNEGLKIPGDFADWAKSTVLGDKKELGINCPDWFWKVNAEDCPGLRFCKDAPHCGYAGAKALLDGARVIVANHSLVGYNTRFSRVLLPMFEVLVLDEAHKASEYIRSAFASELTEHRVPRLLNEIHQADLFERDPVKEVMQGYGRGFFWDDATVQKARAGLEALDQQNTSLFGRFTAPGEFTPEFVCNDTNAMCLSALDILQHLYGLGDIRGDITSMSFFACAKEGTVHPSAVVYATKLQRLIGVLSDLGRDGDADGDFVRHIEFPDRPTKSRRLCAEPINIAPKLQRSMMPHWNVIATSATLTVDNDFTYFHNELGFPAPPNTVTYQVASPFDYANRSLVYLTRRVPIHPSRNKQLLDKNDPAAMRAYMSAMTEEIVDLLLTSRGHALVLFASRKEMDLTVASVREELGNQFPIMEQKEGLPTSVLEEWFRSTPHAVLFGLKSFFEGVDFQGDILRLVIITKAPFPHPSDLVHKAQRKKLGDGYESFLALDVPKMVMDVKQAAGRLIRSMNDYGVVAILDRTLANGMYSGGKYPRRLGKSLPFTRVSSSMKDVKNFLSSFS